MKKAVWIGVLVSLVVIATAFLVLHRRALPLTSSQAASPDTQRLIRDQWQSMGGIPDADWKDELAWEKTPEYQTTQAELRKIDAAIHERGFLTADEAEALINYMHSPHYGVRVPGAAMAGYARFEPARSVLLPYVLGLLSNRVSAVRLWAANSLGKMGDKSVTPSLIPLLKDPIPLVAKAAQEAISKLESRKETVPGE
jgi:hypothetical protein